MRFFDLHCDTLYELTKHEEDIFKNELNVSISSSLRYKPYLGCFAIWIPDNLRGEEAFELFEKCSSKLEFEVQKYSRYFNQIKDLKDLETSLELGYPAVILTLEGSGALMGDITKVKYMKEKGVKIITLTWNGSCEAGDGIGVENPKGLTYFGKKLLTEMEKYNIIVDVSHASEKLFYDVYQQATKPFIATHSNSREVCSHKRNLTDNQFKCIKEKKGLVGITFCGSFLSDSKNSGFDDVIKHTEHFLSLGGEDVVCIGSDFDGAKVPDDLSGLERVEKLYEYFITKNYSEDLLDKIFFSNAYNFLKNSYSE